MKIEIVGDGYEGWNVEVTFSEEKVVFACLDKEHANEIQDQLSECAWAQLEHL